MRNYCSYQQDDWSDLLPLAEYAYNSAISDATKFSPFCVNYGFQPRTNWPNPKPSTEWDNPVSTFKVSQWEMTWQAMGENLGKTRLRMSRWYDNHHQKAPVFKAGDLLMLDHRNVQTMRPMNKLDHKKMGPCKVLQAVGKRAYKLELPPQMKIHPVFHVSLLESYNIPADPKRRIEPPEVEEIEGEENHVIREVADSRVKRNKKKIEYLML
jgi:hypothetical protein